MACLLYIFSFSSSSSFSSCFFSPSFFFKKKPATKQPTFSEVKVVAAPSTYYLSQCVWLKERETRYTCTAQYTCTFKKKVSSWKKKKNRTRSRILFVCIYSYYVAATTTTTILNCTVHDLCLQFFFQWMDGCGFFLLEIFNTKHNTPHTRLSIKNVSRVTGPCCHYYIVVVLFVWW